MIVFFTDETLILSTNLGLVCLMKIKKVQMGKLQDGRKNCVFIVIHTNTTQMLHLTALVLHNFRPM